MNHVGADVRRDGRGLQVRGDLQGVPAAFVPPSFNPANIMESTLDGIKENKRLRGELNLDRIRGNLNRMIEQQFQQRGAR